MTSFMVCNHFLGFRFRVSSLLFQTNHQTIDSAVNFIPTNRSLTLTGSRNGSFVHEILQLGTGISWCSATDSFKIDIRLQGLATGMHTKNSLTTLEVKNINTICCCDGDDTRVSIETIHLNQNLVNGLFTFIVTSSLATSTLASYSINLINKDNARGILIGLSKDVTDTGSSHTNKHLHKFRTTDGDEWDSGFTGNSLGQKSLTSTRRSIKDDTTRDAASIPC